MGGVYTTVQDEFCGWKVSYPIVLSNVSEETKVLLNLLICSFCLTIRLGVIGRGEGMVDTQSLVKGLHEACSKLRAAVRDEFGWNAMQAEYFAVVNVRNTLHIDV